MHSPEPRLFSFILCCTAILMSLLMLWVVALAGDTHHMPESTLNQSLTVLTPPKYFVRPMGQVDEARLTFVRGILEQRFGAEVVVMDPIALPVSAHDERRNQYSAEALLDYLFLNYPPDADRYLGIVSEDIFAGPYEYVYGFSHLQDGVALMSLHRMGEGLQGESSTHLVNLRVEKTVIHEMSHTYNLDHCHVPSCVMQSVESLRSLDQSSRYLCSMCRQQVEYALYHPPKTSRKFIARGDGFYRRGEVRHALFEYTAGLLQSPFDPLMLNELGLAMMALSRNDLSASFFSQSIKLNPKFPAPHYNLGLLFARADQREEAQYWLERGMAVDPDQVEAIGFLGTVYLLVIEDEAKATRYLHEYWARGGSNPAILYRYNQIVDAFTISFDEEEVPSISVPLYRFQAQSDTEMFEMVKGIEDSLR